MLQKKGKIYLGLIGLGQMGRNHLRVLSLLKGVEIKFIYDVDQAVSQKLSETFGVKSISELNGTWPNIDAVLICSPTNTHSDILRIASKHVKNIFIEKPLSHSLKTSQADVSFIKKNNLKVQVGFIERFNPAIHQLKFVLQQSSKVINIDFIRTNKLNSRVTDVDVVTDLMIHDIDLAIYLNGPIKKVTAQGIIDNKIVALASAHLIHENGSLSRLHSSRITEKKVRKIQATCIDSFIDCDLLRKELLIHRQSKIENDCRGNYSINAIEQTVEVKQQEPLLSELQSFIAFCSNLTDEVPTENDALNAAKICDEVLQEILQC